MDKVLILLKEEDGQSGTERNGDGQRQERGRQRIKLFV